MASYNPGMRPTPASPASAAGSPASLSPISALSPLDGRYAGRLGSLRPLMSELGYMHRRVQVEIAWFIALSDAGFDEFIRDNWTPLVAGESVPLRFAVPSRLACSPVIAGRRPWMRPMACSTSAGRRCC